MRVLHLPVNIASQISITVRALRDVGVDARGLVLGSTIVQSPTGIQVFSLGSRKKPLQWITRRTAWDYSVLYEIWRSDVIHWHFALPALPRALDLKWARWLGKPGIVEFWGSDIRVPEEDERDNPYYARRGPDYEYRSVESRALSYTRQECFAKHGVRACLAIKPFSRYLKPGLFAKVYWSRGRVIMSEFQPRYPAPDNPHPILAHSPTAKVAKGTAAVLAAVETLKSQYDFEFRLIHNVPRAQALEMVQTCDIFLDQFVDGNGYGIAATEAMALGKPVVCYIKPSAVPLWPMDIPVINANQDNLAQMLEPLLQSAQLRYEIGKRSRVYAEEHHDAHKYAQWLVTVYQELIEQKRRHV